MQTARPVALFAGNFLHRVSAPAVGLREIGMASSALLPPNFLRAGDVRELAEVLSDLVRGGRLRLVLGGKRRSERQQ